MFNNPTRVYYTTQKASKVRSLNRSLKYDNQVLFATGSNQKSNRVSVWSIDTSSGDDPIEQCYYPLNNESVTDLQFIENTGLGKEDTSLLLSSTSDGSLYLFEVSNIPIRYGGNNDLIVNKKPSAGSVYNRQNQMDTSDEMEMNLEIKVLKKWEKCHNGAINAVTVNPIGERIATVGEDGAINIFEQDSIAPIYTNKNIDGLAINTMKFMSNNEIITSGLNPVLKFWDIRTNNTSSPIKIIKQQPGVQIHSIAVHHDQPHIIATGDSEGNVTLFDYRNSFAIDQNKNHNSNVWEVSFSRAKSNQLFSCSEDGFVYLYDYNRDNTMTTTNIFDLYQKSVSPFITTTTHSSIDSFDINPFTQTMLCTTSTQTLLLTSLKSQQL